MTIDAAKSEDPLRTEISFMGTLLGETISKIAGKQSFQIVEDLRRLAWDRRKGDPEAEPRMVEFIAKLSDDQLRVVIRSFSVFLDLLNLSEDRQRVRVLGKRSSDAYPGPGPESIRDAVTQLKLSGVDADEMQSLLGRFHLELVFTAHPTDAKRRSVRRKLTKLRELLAECDRDLLPMDLDSVHRQLRMELGKLWQTDFIRPWKPQILDEVDRGLSIKPVLWKEVPRILGALHAAVQEHYGDGVKVTRPCVTFGSWIGGDRDGHPGVTADVTKQTFQWLRDAAIDFHLASCDELFDSLSLSTRHLTIGNGLRRAIERASQQWPLLKDRLAEISPNEVFRQWLSVIRWRLVQTQSKTIDQRYVDGAYGRSQDLLDDVTVLFESVCDAPGGQHVAEEVELWMRRIETFGFHLARLDVRQDARVYEEVLNELFARLGIHADPGSLDEAGRTKLIIDTLSESISLNPGNKNLQPIAQDTLHLFELLHRVASVFGSDAIGGHVISMTAAPSDVMTVLWFWTHTADEAASQGFHLPIVPLFETIGDLQHGPGILKGMLACPAYREHLAAQKDHQIIMLGYSDSTKDGGYLSACWALHQAQKELVELANQDGVSLSFFHGRGGSLGRGGGPAARSILSLPVGTFQGALRLTEQGEVLADRYDDPAIAHRHLEQMVWSSLLAAGKSSEPAPQSWSHLLDEMAACSFTCYRELVEQKGFVEFFRLVTPISEIEQLPIGSRPSRRRGGNSLSDLRAIPWVFSWTQSRCLIPAWYGLGTALNKKLQDGTSADSLKRMYRDWSFFRACIDNAELALAKTDLGIAEHYASLADGSPALGKIASLVDREFRATREAVLALSGSSELLDGTPWLKESIRVRNRYIDPLNLIQVELLRRCHQSADPDQVDPQLRHLTRLTINGIAAGMRTSG